MHRLLVVLVLVVVAVVHLAEAQVYVSSSSGCVSGCGAVGNPWPRLSQGISAVSPSGGTVIVAAGTYTGTGNYNLGIASSGPITIRSSSGNTDIILDCGSAGPAFTIQSTGDVFISGFHFQNCVRFNTSTTPEPWPCGGAVRVNSVATHIDKSIFTNNAATDGGAVCVTSATLTISNSHVSGNDADNYGGGIFIRTTDFRAWNTTFDSNQAPVIGANVYCDNAAITTDLVTNLGASKDTKADCDSCGIFLEGFRINACNCSQTAATQQGEQQVVYYGEGYPQITFNGYQGGSVQQDAGYVVYLNEVRELDGNKNYLSNYSLPTCGYNATSFTAGVHTYTRPYNRALFTFQFTYYATPTTVVFGDTSFMTYGDSTLMSVKIEDWPFAPGAEYLQFSFGLNPLSGTFDPPTVAPVPGNSALTEITYRESTGAYTARYTVLNLALIDGVTSTDVDFEVVGNNAILTLPAFTSSAQWDPDLGLVLASKEEDGSSDDSWVIAVAVVVPVVFFVAAAVIIGVGLTSWLLRKRFRRTITRRLNSGSDVEDAMPTGGNPSMMPPRGVN